MTELGPDFVSEGVNRASDRTILLMPTPGEQHTFGLGMVEKFFRRAGWNVAGGGQGPGVEFDRLLRRESFSVVGLSLSSSIKMASLVSTIRTIRKVSRNKSVCIMVGGPVFVDRPEMGVLVGADATASNGPAAVLVAQSLLDLRLRA
jgi:methanogenic corrinoid protein MtbC1